MFSARVNSVTSRIFRASAILEGITLEEATDQALMEWATSPKRKIPVGDIIPKQNEY